MLRCLQQERREQPTSAIPRLCSSASQVLRATVSDGPPHHRPEPPGEAETHWEGRGPREHAAPPPRQRAPGSGLARSPGGWGEPGPSPQGGPTSGPSGREGAALWLARAVVPAAHLAHVPHLPGVHPAITAKRLCRGKWQVRPRRCLRTGLAFEVRTTKLAVSAVSGVGGELT